MGLELKKAGETAEEELPGDFWRGKIPCWQMCHCPEGIKNECPATRYPSYPCWEIEGTYLKLTDNGNRGDDINICQVCRVYKKYGQGKSIKIRLFGKGVDALFRFLKEKTEALG